MLIDWIAIGKAIERLRRLPEPIDRMGRALWGKVFEIFDDAVEVLECFRRENDSEWSIHRWELFQTVFCAQTFERLFCVDAFAAIKLSFGAINGVEGVVIEV